MANTSKHKFKDIKKKLKGDIALGIHQILNKISKTAGDKAKKNINAAAAKVAKDFIKKLKKEEKATKPVAKTKPARKTAAAASATKRKPAAKKRPTRKPAVKKESVEVAEMAHTPEQPAENTHHEHHS
jgi:hypothetical protein